MSAGQRRAAAIVALGATVAAGLLSRSGAAWVPTWVAAHAGDALWSVALYCVLVALWPRGPAWAIAAATLAGSFAVEASQLLHGPTLDALRERRLVRLLFGTTFVWGDLARYAAGTALAWLFDIAASRRCDARRHRTRRID